MQHPSKHCNKSTLQYHDVEGTFLCGLLQPPPFAGQHGFRDYMQRFRGSAWNVLKLCSKNSYYPKWILFVENMRLKEAMQTISAKFRNLHDVSTLDLESSVSIPIRFRTPTTQWYLTATSHPLMDRQKAVKLAKKGDGVKYLTGSIKTVTHEVKHAWESGNPISRNEIYLRLIQKFGKIEKSASLSEFCSTMKLNEGDMSPSRAQWVRRQLEGACWSIRKECVSQKIPTNWVAIALETSTKIRAKLKECTCLPAQGEYIQTWLRTEGVHGNGVCRNVLFNDSPPFIVMTATHNGTVARRFASWREDGGDASVHFQPSHWMDTPTAKTSIDFLISFFPGKTSA
ncbi:hypothetical protein PHMEG_00017885 [Phytophthora megakarya]|uniref:Uncharacterized protein n=1 Tax=Phytophthora megakarya TaxID=4795 RepID=A0A225VW66_9STRA|nr:hypothetical protein PHMEG_00017885 [Phytophthora megakarya]